MCTSMVFIFSVFYRNTNECLHFDMSAQVRTSQGCVCMQGIDNVLGLML